VVLKIKIWDPCIMQWGMETSTHVQNGGICRLC